MWNMVRDYQGKGLIPTKLTRWDSCSKTEQELEVHLSGAVLSKHGKDPRFVLKHQKDDTKQDGV